MNPTTISTDDRIRFEIVDTPEFDTRGNRIYARVWRNR